jgi:hypothetical protein
VLACIGGYSLEVARRCGPVLRLRAPQSPLKKTPHSYVVLRGGRVADESKPHGRCTVSEGRHQHTSEVLQNERVCLRYCETVNLP